MRSPRIASLAVPLVLAGAAAVLWPGPGGNPPTETAGTAPMKRSHRAPAEVEPNGSGRTSSPASSATLPFAGSEIRRHRPRQADPPGSAVPAGTAAATETPPVEQRLHELTVTLGLTDTQRRMVRPLLARSSPGFDPSLMPSAPGDFATPLTPAEADGEIHALLDPVQQGEFEELLLGRDQWWAEIIGRLERDLHQSTDPSRSFSPEEDAPPAEPAAPATAPRPGPHHGENIFDLLREP